MKNIFNYLVSILVFLTSSAYVIGQQLIYTQLNMFKILVPLIWLVGLSMSPMRNIKNIWLNALAVYIFIQVVMLKAPWQNVAIEPLIDVFLGIILYYSLAHNLEDSEPVLNGICWAIGFQAIFILLQALKIDPICLNEAGTKNLALVGLFGRKYVLGAWMAIATPVLLFNKRIAFGILSAILCVCSMSWASIGLLLLTLFAGLTLVNRKYLIWSIVTLIAIGSIVYSLSQHPYYVNGNNPPALRPTSIQYKVLSRIDMESRLLPALFVRPVVGHGLGAFKFIGPLVNAYPYGTLRDTWNDYLEQGIQLGLGFIVLFLILCLDTFKRFKRSVKTPSTIGLFCSLLLIPSGMLFHDLFNHTSVVTLIICVFASFTIRSGQYEALMA